MNIKEIENVLETAYFRDTSEKIKQLSGESKERFQQSLASIDDTWLSLRGLNNSNCSENRIKIVLYKEMFEKDFSYLHRD